jgi:hypothetical protein
MNIKKVITMTPVHTLPSQLPLKVTQILVGNYKKTKTKTQASLLSAP